jgi:hypothetical protein
MLRFLLVVALGALAATCQADVIYSDIPASDPFFDPGSGALVNGYAPSISFSPSVNEFLTEVDYVASIARAADLGSDPTITLSISSDDSGLPSYIPGDSSTALATETLDITEAANGASHGAPTPDIAQWILSDPLLLEAGTQYWLTFSTTSQIQVTWNANETQASGDFIYSGTSWAAAPNSPTIGAVSIQGEPTPEPGTFALFAGAFAAAAVLRRRRP